MTYTYNLICIVCPHCGAHTRDSVNHLSPGTSFGPWYCDCGGSYTGVANGTSTAVVKSDNKKVPVLSLLVLDPRDTPVFFVMRGNRYSNKHHTDTDGNIRYYYEEHSCPINWIGNAVCISTDGDMDPHGLLRYVRTIPDIPLSFDADERLMLEFPELIQPEMSHEPA